MTKNFNKKNMYYVFNILLYKMLNINREVAIYL